LLQHQAVSACGQRRFIVVVEGYVGHLCNLSMKLLGSDGAGQRIGQ
jgi:hypothetical protein